MKKLHPKPTPTPTPTPTPKIGLGMSFNETMITVGLIGVAVGLAGYLLFSN